MFILWRLQNFKEGQKIDTPGEKFKKKKRDKLK